MLKILWVRLQQYVNHELPDVPAGFSKGRGTRDQISNIHWIMEKAREFQKNIYFWFIDYAKAFSCVDHNQQWKILKEMGILDCLICLLRNLYAGQEGTVRMIHETMDWFQIGKRVRQVCILSPCLFNFYAEYIMWNAALDEAQAGIKTASWNSNNLRYVDNTTLMAEMKSNWTSWWRWKRRVTKLAWNSTFKKLRSWHPVPSLCGKNGEKTETDDRFYFPGLQNHCGWWLQPWN